MKSLMKGLLIVAAMLSFAAAANAEEVSKTSDNVSFNYGDNTFTITDTTTQETETELTVMLVKGDYTTTSLSTVTAADICYIGQAGGTSYSELFTNLGVKYTDGEFEPGEYTLVKSGEGMSSASKTKIFLGNAVNTDGEVKNMHSRLIPDGKAATFGTMSQTLRVIEASNSGKYIYIGVGEFTLAGDTDTTDLGFAFQKKESDDVLKKTYKSLNDLGLTALDNVTSINGGTVKVGIQISELPLTTEIVAIPYVLTTASGAVAE